MINNSMEDIKNYQMIKLTDGTLLVGKIIQTVQLGDNKYLKVKNPLELKSLSRVTGFGIKEDSTLTPWIPFTTTNSFRIPTDKIMTVVEATKDLSHYYEVILNKLTNETPKHAPLTTDEINKILKIADELDRQERGEEYSEEDIDHLVDGTKTVH
tara:strand:+ start:75 stop:539 length:465 start_codon:yes stop_codon:yes gene_type:complete